MSRKAQQKSRKGGKWDKDITQFMEDQGMLVARERMAITHPVIAKNIKNK